MGFLLHRLQGAVCDDGDESGDCEGKSGSCAIDSSGSSSNLTDNGDFFPSVIDIPESLGFKIDLRSFGLRLDLES